MAGDGFKKPMQGKPLRLDARAFGFMLDAAASEKGRAHDDEADLSVAMPSNTIVPVRNSSGTTRNQFDVVGVKGPLVLPTQNLDEFKRRPMVDGGKPAAGNFLILQEPLNVDSIGRGAIDGVTIGRVKVTLATAGLTNADAMPDDPSQLALQANGTAKVIWRDPSITEGTAWALLLLGGGACCAPPDDTGCCGEQFGGTPQSWTMPLSYFYLADPGDLALSRTDIGSITMLLEPGGDPLHGGCCWSGTLSTGDVGPDPDATDHVVTYRLCLKILTNGDGTFSRYDAGLAVTWSSDSTGFMETWVAGPNPGAGGSLLPPYKLACCDPLNFYVQVIVDLDGVRWTSSMSGYAVPSCAPTESGGPPNSGGDAGDGNDGGDCFGGITGPDLLHVSFDASGSTCDCSDGVSVPINWDEADGTWNAGAGWSELFCDVQYVGFKFGCVGSHGLLGLLIATVAGSVFVPMTLSGPPLSATGHIAAAALAGLGFCSVSDTGNITITVS